MLALIALLAGAAVDGGPAPVVDVLQVATCQSQGGEYDVTLEGTLVLHRDFLDPAVPPEQHARAAVLHQLKYVWGWLRTNPEAARTLQAVLSAVEPPIEVRAIKPGKYGHAMDITFTEEKPHLVIDDPYQVRALKRGRTRVNDPALMVDYRVVFRMGLCGPARDRVSTLTLPLPRDPWLMHWHVPRSQHRLLRYYTKSAVTNPCADDDYADLPHPIYYWYDWQPDRHGPDANHRAFDCRKLLKEGRDYFPHTLQLVRVAEPTGDFSLLRDELARDSGPVRVTLLYGVLDHEVTQPDVAALAGELGAGAPLATRVAQAHAAARPRERAERQLLALLEDLPQVLQVERHTASASDGYFHFEAHGTLVRSRRAVRLRAHYGLTNVFGPVPPAHWRYAREALGQDHVVIYVGHSGIGENVRLLQIDRNLGLPAGQLAGEIAHAPYQLVAFLSCYSYMYFGQDMLEAGAKGREFVFTGTGYGRGDRGALMVLDVLDQALAPDRAPLQVHFLEPTDFMLFKARHGAAVR
ncbi:MAG: hypothetical protein HY904_17600 [Deltaproteobacteria bacterium]|nr:hypothetical protein [Deltaproteobacteria bacterium]